MTSSDMDNSKRGLHNWRNLFRKPTLNEWIILFMLILSLFLAWAYKTDIQKCNDFLVDIQASACNICQQQVDNIVSGIRMPNLTINEGYYEGGNP